MLIVNEPSCRVKRHGKMYDCKLVGLQVSSPFFVSDREYHIATINLTVAEYKRMFPDFEPDKHHRTVSIGSVPLADITIDSDMVLQFYDSYTEHPLYFIADWLPHRLSLRWRHRFYGTTTYQYIPVSDFKFAKG